MVIKQIMGAKIKHQMVFTIEKWDIPTIKQAYSGEVAMSFKVPINVKVSGWVVK